MKRGTDSPADLERRLRGAPAEVEQYKDFQYLILNDDINRASQQLAAVIYAERARREREREVDDDEQHGGTRTGLFTPQELPVLPSEGLKSQGPLRDVVVDREPTVVDILP